MTIGSKFNDLKSGMVNTLDKISDTINNDKNAIKNDLSSVGKTIKSDADKLGNIISKDAPIVMNELSKGATIAYGEAKDLGSNIEGEINGLVDKAAVPFTAASIGLVLVGVFLLYKISEKA